MLNLYFSNNLGYCITFFLRLSQLEVRSCRVIRCYARSITSNSEQRVYKTTIGAYLNLPTVLAYGRQSCRFKWRNGSHSEFDAVRFSFLHLVLLLLSTASFLLVLFSYIYCVVGFVWLLTVVVLDIRCSV